MIEETQVAHVDATEQPAATPENVASQEAGTETAEGEKEIQAEVKTFTQDDIDRIVQKEKTKAVRRAEKDYQARLESLTAQPLAAPPATQVDTSKPKLANFENVEDYVEAVADWKMAQKENVIHQAKVQANKVDLENRSEKIYEQAEKIAGFDRDVFDELPLTQSIANALLDSDIAPRLMAHLAGNPEEVARINKLSPARQAAEIGKIEARLSEVKPVKTSSAPAPIKPVGNRGGAVAVDINNMSMAEYKAFRAKAGARWATP